VKQKIPSLERQLQTLILLALGFATLAMGGFWLTHTRISLEQAAVRTYTIQADMIASVAKPALMFADKKLAYELIAKLKTNPDMIALRLYTADGKLIASLPETDNTSESGHTAMTSGETAAFEENCFRVQRAVFHKQAPVGFIYVEFDIANLKSHEHSNLLTVLLAMMATLTFSFLLALRLQRKLKKSENDLRLAIDQAESANRAKSEFLSTMSHELRTPIHGIIGLQQLIASDAENLTSEQRENLMLAQQSAKSLRALVNDILDLAKVESGNMETAETEFDLPHLLRESLTPFRALVLEKGLQLSLHLNHVPKHVVADELRLRQILLNLVGNAVKFTHRGEVSLHVTEEGGQLRFAVKDTGIGLAPEDIERVFEPFVQILGPQTKREGTGLGTSIAKQFVELMGGTINVESQPDEGSCFSFTIPYRPVDSEIVHFQEDSIDNPYKTVPVPGEKRAEMAPAPLRVLLAEDDPVGRRIAIKQLSRAGISVDAVDNGQTAWEKIQKHDYDLLLTDIRMPDMDGIELTRRVREREENSDISKLPIIGLSAHALEEVVNECLIAGMDHFMAKPIDPEAIIATILMSTSPKA